MDILNWIYLKKQNLIRPLTEPGSVIAIGSPDARRGDSYLTTGILVNDLIGALPVSFAELQTSITNSKLIPGKKYVITDYQTIYDQPDYDNAGLPKTVVSTLSGIVEPLIVIAVNNNEISSQVYSSLFPNDILEYDITFTFTEIMNAPAKGRITSRTDNNKNITNYDNRAVSFKRYETISGSGIYDSYKDTGFNSNANIKTFQPNSWNNNLENFYTTDSLGIQDFILPNNVFGEYTYDNKFGNYFINNTFGMFIYDNEINEECYNNLIGDQFFRNIIGNGFSNNIISTEFKNNHILNGFRNNVIGAQFQNNTINSGFRENITAAGFAFNQIGYDFRNPGITIESGFISNRIANNFGPNTAIGTNFSSNVIFDNFQNNTIDDDFTNNNIKVKCDNVLPASWAAQPKVYTTSYCEVINGFDAGGVAQTQSYLGWFDTSLGQFQYSGL
jgi:hypothetical protein